MLWPMLGFAGGARGHRSSPHCARYSAPPVPIGPASTSCSMPTGWGAACAASSNYPARRATAAPRRGVSPRPPATLAHAGAPDHVERRDGAGHDNPADASGRREGASRAAALAVADFRHSSIPARRGGARAGAAAGGRPAGAAARRGRAHRQGRLRDLRRTIHASGPWWDSGRSRLAAPHDKPLRLVVLLDASGSMSLYTASSPAFSTAYPCLPRGRGIRVPHAARAGIGFDAGPRLARALTLSLMAEGIGGGTRIGECLATSIAGTQARHDRAPPS